jgi:hypothetical protein
MEPILPPPPPRDESPFTSAAPFAPQQHPTIYPAYGAPPPMKQTRRHGLAVAAMVCGIVGIPLFVMFGILPLLGLIFGLVSASTIKRSEGALTGLGMARAGWILGVVGLLGFGVFIWAAASGRLDDTTVSDTAKVGSCVGKVPAEGELVFELDLINCASKHQAEVFAIDKLNAAKDRKFPGEAAVSKQVQTACIAAFADYIGRDFNDSKLDFSPLQPNEIGWKRGGEYTCLVFDPAGDVTGSLAGADR